ncbi:alpha/beta fold hydrolase [Nocardia farcinica]
MTSTHTEALTESGTSRSVTTQDWTLHYHEAGTGHPVILLHGSGPGATGWSNYEPNIAALAQHFRVLAVDMPGWGGSDAVGAADADRYDHVATLVQFMDALNIDRAAVVGNSMGGITAVRFAAEHPERISHLITMGAVSGPRPKLFGPADGPTEGLKVLFRGYFDPSVESMRQLVNVMTFDPAFATDALVERRSRDAQARPEHLANFLALAKQGKGPIPAWASWEQIAGITAPTLLIHGRDDRVVHFENSLELVSLIPNSRLLLLGRCGHWAQLEHAAEFNRIVADFINNQFPQEGA